MTVWGGIIASSISCGPQSASSADAPGSCRGRPSARARSFPVPAGTSATERRVAPSPEAKQKGKQKGKQADGLTPEMKRRVNAALAAADDAGVELGVESGWRSKARQKVLFAQAVEKYGTARAARSRRVE